MLIHYLENPFSEMLGSCIAEIAINKQSKDCPSKTVVRQKEKVMYCSSIRKGKQTFCDIKQQ